MRLDHGCINVAGEKQYGMLRIRCGEAARTHNAPDKRPETMTGERLRWRRAIICVSFGVRLMNLAKYGKTKKEALVHWQQLPELEQDLPCGGLVAVAYALSAAGFPTSVSSIVSFCRLPVSVLLLSTLTLGQVATVAQQYIAVRKLPVRLAAVYFDSAAVTLDLFKDALTTVANREARDQLILNYDAQVAQARSGMSALQRNGWGLVSSLDGASQEVEIYDALGTSAAAGSRWSTSLNKMFSALCERCEPIALLFAQTVF